MSVGRAVREGDLGSPETELFGDLRAGTGKVERNIFLGSTTDHFVDRFTANLAEEIPNGEVDNGDGSKRET